MAFFFLDFLLHEIATQTCKLSLEKSFSSWTFLLHEITQSLLLVDTATTNGAGNDEIVCPCPLLFASRTFVR